MGKQKNPHSELTLKTLLFTIVKNKALNKISHFEIKRKVHLEIAEKYESEFSSPDFYLENELFRLYEEALRKLPAEFRQAYEMNRNQQLTHKEIAEKLNVSPQTVNYRIGQALKILRSELKDYLPLIMLFLFLQGHNEMACPPPAAMRIFIVSLAVTSCSVI